MRTLLALLLVLALAPAAFAKGSPKGNHGKAKGNHARAADRADRDHGRDGDGDNGRYRFGSARNDSRPPGWDRGKKTGWGDCDVPPGQAKKQGCTSVRTRRTRRVIRGRSADTAQRTQRRRGTISYQARRTQQQETQTSTTRTTNSTSSGSRVRRPSRTTAGSTNDVQERVTRNPR